MLNILLLHNSNHGFTRRGVIDITTSKEFVDNIIHFHTTQYLTLRYGCITCKTQCKSLIDFFLRTRSALHCRSYHVIDKRNDIQSFYTCRNSINSITTTTKAIELEAHLSHFRQNLVENHLVRDGELNHLWEEYFLGMYFMFRQLTQILLIENTNMRTMLVDNHKARLHSCHDITALILIMRRCLVFYQRF